MTTKRRDSLSRDLARPIPSRSLVHLVRPSERLLHRLRPLLGHLLAHEHWSRYFLDARAPRHSVSAESSCASSAPT
jgi:hypothetical protein